MMPPLRTFWKSDNSVRLTVPKRVTKKSSLACFQVRSSLLAPYLEVTRTSVWIFSSALSSNRLAMLRPLAARPMSGISWTRSTYTRPRFVKNMR